MQYYAIAVLGISALALAFTSLAVPHHIGKAGLISLGIALAEYFALALNYLFRQVGFYQAWLLDPDSALGRFAQTMKGGHLDVGLLLICLFLFLPLILLFFEIGRIRRAKKP